MSSNQRKRDWCFTINDYDDDDIMKLRDISVDTTYMVWGKETAPTTGTRHLQGYVYFTNAKTFSAVKKLMPKGAHLEAAKGSAEQNKEYCEKEGDSEEYGTMPKKHGDGGAAKNKERWDAARKHARDGNFDEIDSDIYVRCYGTLKKIRQDELTTARGTHDTEQQMLWFWGPSGTNKSRTARLKYPNAYLKMCNKWWDNYQGQDTVLIEDFDEQHKVLIHHMKIWADRYSFMAEVKGHCIEIRPERIVVTSNYHPSQIWDKPEDLEPILRRFKTIEFPNNDPEYGGMITGSSGAAASTAASTSTSALAPTFHLPGRTTTFTDD